MGRPRISVSLDRGQAYFPGETLRGEVHLNWEKGGCAKYIRLQCVGVIHFKRRPKTDLSDIHRNLQDSDQTSILFHHDDVVWGKRNQASSLVQPIFESSPIPRGKQTFPFEFRLARRGGKSELDLPSSFQNRNVAVTYFINVTVFRSWPRKDISHFHPFIVACVNDINKRRYRKPLTLSRGVDVGLLGVFKKGTIEARVTIPRRAYCKGDNIPVRMQISHLGNVKHITGVQISLMRFVRWTRPPKAKNSAGNATPSHHDTSDSGAKIGVIREIYEPLLIKPGDVNVDVTVNYYLNPHDGATKRQTRDSNSTSLALHHSDDFPWSSVGKDDLVQISYELRVQLKIGANRRSTTAGLHDDAPQQTSGEVILEVDRRRATNCTLMKRCVDGMLSGGQKVLHFAFPIIIGTIPLNQSTSTPPSQTTMTPSITRTPSAPSTITTSDTRPISAGRPRRNTIAGESNGEANNRPSSRRSRPSLHVRTSIQKPQRRPSLATLAHYPPQGPSIRHLSTAPIPSAPPYISYSPAIQYPHVSSSYDPYAMPNFTEAPAAPHIHYQTSNLSLQTHSEPSQNGSIRSRRSPIAQSADLMFYETLAVAAEAASISGLSTNVRSEAVPPPYSEFG